ncbi:MAG: MAPEG family protein [Cellvibrionaceae bacterium]
MNAQIILWPVLLNIVLAVLLYFKLISAKKAAVAAGTVDESRRALHDDAWPDSVVQVNNCIRNQFEAPVLFYAVIGVIYALNAVNWIALSLAWIFVTSRYFHAYVHTGSNFVPRRRRFFTVSVLSILALTVYAALHLL